MSNKKGGVSILGVIVLLIVGILILSYFNISIKKVVESPIGKENIGYVTENSKSVWDKYLKGPMTYLWNDVFMKIFWVSFIDNMERIRDGKPTDFEKFAPQVKINEENSNTSGNQGNSSGI